MGFHMINYNKCFRVKKPYSDYIDKIIKKEIALVKNKKDGLYLCRIHAKDKTDTFGIKTLKHNNWILFQKKPLKKKLTGINHNWYGL